MTDPLNIAQTIKIAGSLIKQAADTPESRAAARELGKSALTLTRAINVGLLPLAAVNYLHEKAKNYFEREFAGELEAKATNIPADQIVEPKASVVGPALHGLAFAHEEPDLKEMYLNLLKSAIDGRVAPALHPGFVEILKQLTAREAVLLRPILQSDHLFPIAELRRKIPSTRSWSVLRRHVLPLVSDSSRQPEVDDFLPSMVDNWARLGLVDVSYDKQLEGIKAYDWVELRPEFSILKAQHHEQESRIDFAKGVLTRTDLGARFALAVGLLVV